MKNNKILQRTLWAEVLHGNKIVSGFAPANMPTSTHLKTLVSNTPSVYPYTQSDQ